MSEHLLLEKPLPSSPNSERLVLGSIIIDNQIMGQAVRVLTPDDFYSPLNKTIYRMMCSLFNKSRAINPVALFEEAKNHQSGIPLSSITELVTGIPIYSNIAQFLDIIKDKSKLRTIIRLCGNIAAEAVSEEYNAAEILQRTESAVFSLSSRHSDTGFTGTDELVTDSIAAMHRMSESDSVVLGIHTCFEEIDHSLLGFQPTDLIILGARPSVGKTSLMLQFAANAALHDNANVAIFSLEMSKSQLITRMLCAEGRINSIRYRTGSLLPSEHEALENASVRIAEAPIYINDRGSVSVEYMRAELRRLSSELRKQRNSKVDIVFVDYLQLMSSPWRDSRINEVTKISTDLKTLAKEFEVPVIALSQLSRESERRNNRKPILPDLRDSGAIEQNADVVLFIYREDMYREDPAEHDHQAEIIIAKNRNGPIGSVMLGFEKQYTRFCNLEELTASYAF